jgi:subtilisin family serine protease
MVRKKHILVLLLIGLSLTLILPNVVVQAKPEAVISSTLLEEPLGASIDVLISTHSQDYSSVRSLINAYGGVVKQEFKYASGIAASIPSSLLTVLETTSNVKRVALDSLRYLEEAPILNDPSGRKQGKPVVLEDDFEVVSRELIADLPETYVNPTSMGAEGVWATGNMGQGSLSVIIDTGVYADHFMLGRTSGDPFYGPCVGGEDRSTDVGTFFEGWDSPYNHWHGTHVAGILAGLGGLAYEDTHPFYYYYTKWIDPDPYQLEDGRYLIPLTGMAPASEIYAIKVFPWTGAGAPESVIIGAIERAIDMHLSGEYDVDVISMSLGGGTGFDGRDLEDQTVDYATSLGITVVTSNGNAGPASMTSGSPATANTAISVGAVNHPTNTRFFMDYYRYRVYGDPIGDYVMPHENPQIIYFSSRGPTSDGRDVPTVSATGFYVFSAYIVPYDPGVSYMAWAGGTSMACPAVSGTVALLNTWNEAFDLGASPYDYKQAIVDGAVPLEDFDEYDQGAGFLNAENAFYSFLDDPSYGDEHPRLKCWYKRRPVKPKGINTGIRGSGEYSYYFDQLEPGLGVDFYFKASKFTKKITIEFTDFETGEDPIWYNALELYLQSAVRTDEDYFVDSLVFGDAIFTFEDYSTSFEGAIWPYAAQDLKIQPGWMRIVVQTAWDSYDWCSGTMKVTVEEEIPRRRYWKANRPDECYFGIFGTGDTTDPFPVGFGPNGVKLELYWLRDWRRYPTSDLDMIVEFYDLNSLTWNITTAGATMHSPEFVLLEHSNIQEVLVTISGYQTYDRYELWWLKVYYL